MQTFMLLWLVVLSAAVVLAFLGAGQLTARLVAAEKELADLKSAVHARRRVAEPMPIDWADNKRCFVLAVEPRCLACKDRIAEFSALVADLPEAASQDRFVILSPQAVEGSDSSLGRVQTMIDDRRFGELAITATPSVLTFDADGTERTRTVVGNKNALARAVEQFELVTARRPS